MAIQANSEGDEENINLFFKLNRNQSIFCFFLVYDPFILSIS